MNAVTVAGVISTLLFLGSNLPMVVRAARTRDLRSYSRGNLVMTNIGNAVYTVYVLSLPAGPIWLLHTFYVISSALMLVWSLRYGRRPSTAETPAVSTATSSGVRHAH